VIAFFFPGHLKCSDPYTAGTPSGVNDYASCWPHEMKLSEGQTIITCASARPLTDIEDRYSRRRDPATQDRQVTPEELE